MPLAQQDMSAVTFAELTYGVQLGAADLMIEAHARALGVIVVTNNVKDFGRVKGLQVEYWTQ